MAKLELLNISKSYGATQALANISIKIESGLVHSFIGKSGSGKSTCIKIMSGLEQADSGRILIDGEDTYLENNPDARRYGIATSLNEKQIIDSLTIAENLYLTPTPNFLGFINHSHLAKKSMPILENLELDVNPKAKASALTQAQKQLLKVGRILNSDSQIAILDEPTSSLGSKESSILLKLINRLRAKGCAIIFTSQRIEEIIQISDKITIFRDSRIVDSVPSYTSREELISLMTGTTPLKSNSRESTARPKQILQVENLNRTPVITNFNLQLNEGEIVCLTGLAGSGKTSVLRAISGLDRYDSGIVTANHKTLKKGNIKDAIEAGIGFVPDQAANNILLDNESVEFNVTLPSLWKYSKFFIPKSKLLKHKATTILDMFRISNDDSKQNIGDLNRATKLKIVIARLILRGNKVLLIDEPTRAVKTRAKIGIHELMSKYVGKRRAIIMSTSDFSEAVSIADRVIVLNQGNIVGELSGKDLTEKKILDLSTRVTK